MGLVLSIVVAAAIHPDDGGGSDLRDILALGCGGALIWQQTLTDEVVPTRHCRSLTSMCLIAPT